MLICMFLCGVKFLLTDGLMLCGLFCVHMQIVQFYLEMQIYVFRLCVEISDLTECIITIIVVFLLNR